VADPITERKEIGLQTIRATMKHISLRRIKDEVSLDVELVTKTVQKCYIKFPKDSEHKRVYDALYNTARHHFLTLLGQGRESVFLHFMELLTLVLRIRQSCCHLSLIPQDYRERAMNLEGMEGGNAETMNKLSEDEGKTLLTLLNGVIAGPATECAVCFETLEQEDTVILRTCKHVFCETCLHKIRDSKCPMCRQDYTESDMINQDAAKAATTQPKFSIKDAKKADRSPKVSAHISIVARCYKGVKYG
jgi:SNF2 family DNA or RNA helicase